MLDRNHSVLPNGTHVIWHECLSCSLAHSWIQVSFDEARIQVCQGLCIGKKNDRTYVQTYTGVWCMIAVHSGPVILTRRSYNKTPNVMLYKEGDYMGGSHRWHPKPPAENVPGSPVSWSPDSSHSMQCFMCITHSFYLWGWGEDKTDRLSLTSTRMIYDDLI